MTTITNLSVELLLAVLKPLNVFDLECVAKTFNKTLYNASILLLLPHKEWIRNARHMSRLFQSPKINNRGTRRLLPSLPGHIQTLEADTSEYTGFEEIPHKEYKAFGLDPEGGPYIRSSPAELRPWMKLDGSLSWLEPLGKVLRESVAVYTGHEGDKRLAEEEDVRALTAQAEERGLVLPPGFVSFISSAQFHHRMASTRAWFFDLREMIPCPPELDDGEGGYIVRFHMDQQACGFAYLYLSPIHYHHCVLFSFVDLYAAEEDASAEASQSEASQNDDGSGSGVVGVPKEDFLLWAFTFEEYLAERYYTEILRYRLYGSRDTPSDGLKNFVRHVYRSPLEVEHLREHNDAIATFLDAQGWEGKKEWDLAHPYEESASTEDQGWTFIESSE